ncbi:MAG: hypothetical protein B1H12_01590 [Desulfobacteraceae bacterium 4484_190.2]|nr:MAG: hypothetical protein B1H12_01590 [Desulfobacteraceae bacterium 4484_190.2]
MYPFNQAAERSYFKVHYVIEVFESTKTAQTIHEIQCNIKSVSPKREVQLTYEPISKRIKEARLSSDNMFGIAIKLLINLKKVLYYLKNQFKIQNKKGDN